MLRPMSNPGETAVQVLPDARRVGETQGVRFRVTLEGVSYDAFAVRWSGRLHAYVNRCPHQGNALDFGDAVFFDEACDALVCTHHGARFHPADGLCVDGPCRGGRLTALALELRDGALWCVGRALRP